MILCGVIPVAAFVSCLVCWLAHTGTMERGHCYLFFFVDSLCPLSSPQSVRRKLTKEERADGSFLKTKVQDTNRSGEEGAGGCYART